MELQVAELQALDVSLHELQELICGPAPEKVDFDLTNVFHIVLDKQLRDSSASGSAPLAESLWRVLGAFPPALKMQFVAFVTASRFLPTPKSEMIRVELPFMALSQEEKRAQMGMLPQAHTCENLLEVPDYWQGLLRAQGLTSAPSGQRLRELEVQLDRVVDERLRYAVANCAGYDLDDESA